jgi:hypothetical protein
MQSFLRAIRTHMEAKQIKEMVDGQQQEVERH